MGAGYKHVRQKARRLEKLRLVLVALRQRVHRQQLHLALGIRADLHFHFGFAAMPGAREHLLAHQRQLDRTPDRARRNHTGDVVRPRAGAFGAKAAASEVVDGAHLFGRQLEQISQSRLGRRRALSRLINREAAIVKVRDVGVRLDGIVMQIGGVISRLDFARRTGKRPRQARRA